MVASLKIEIGGNSLHDGIDGRLEIDGWHRAAL
jgi:hypothetical protein